MTNRELQDLLKQYPDDAPVYIDLNFLDEPIECNRVDYFDQSDDFPGIFLDD
jgi:hypothetical protein